MGPFNVYNPKFLLPTPSPKHRNHHQYNISVKTESIIINKSKLNKQGIIKRPVYFLCYRNINGPDNYAIWISILLGGLSMLAKETGITVFLLNMAFDSYRCWPTIKRNILDVRWTEETQQFSRRITKVLLSMGVLLAIRLALLQGSLPKFSQQDNPAAFHPNLYVR